MRNTPSSSRNQSAKHKTKEMTPLDLNNGIDDAIEELEARVPMTLSRQFGFGSDGTKTATSETFRLKRSIAALKELREIATPAIIERHLDAKAEAVRRKERETCFGPTNHRPGITSSEKTAPSIPSENQ